MDAVNINSALNKSKSCSVNIRLLTIQMQIEFQYKICKNFNTKLLCFNIKSIKPFKQHSEIVTIFAFLNLH